MEDHVRNPSLTGARIVLGVTGSIAAYKAVTLLRALVREGAVIDVAMTRSATKFVTPLTFEVLSGRPVAADLFQARSTPTSLLSLPRPQISWQRRLLEWAMTCCQPCF
jgi:phosphopantothenoylcysteine decarboxylase/phosphopantothenate--cysteine ligase